MRIATLCLVAASVCGSSPLANAQQTYPIEDFLDTVAVTGGSFAHDGSAVLVSTDETGIFNAFALPVAGSPAEQLTHSTTNSVFAVSYFPNDERFLYHADQGGNELTHVYVQAADGTVRDLTPGEGLKASFFGWRGDDAAFYVISNERDPKNFDLYEYDAATYAREIVFENNDGYTVQAVSPNGRYVAIGKSYTRLRSTVSVYDRESGTLEGLLGDDTSDVANTAQAFTPDNDALICLTDRDHEFRYAVSAPLSGEPPTVVRKEDWDVVSVHYSKHGRYRLDRVNVDSILEVRMTDLESGESVELRKNPGDGISFVVLSNDESKAAYYVQGARTPGDVYTVTLDGAAPPARLTRRLSERIDENDLVTPEIVRFESYDGVTVPGILYKPMNASFEDPVAALVYVHGGPGGQTRASYNPLVQYLVNHGYAVYGINNRGSSGYGKTFFAMDDLNHGNADLDDCVASKQMLIATGWVDPDRIGIIGGSYGGYMVCAALAFRPTEFDVGVNIYGVTNWVRTLKSIPPWWGAARDSLYAELGDPFEQEDYLTSISPLFHAENIGRPLMVLQGANDPRVLQVESDEIVAAARANDVPVEYLVFEDEGHGFRKKANQIMAYRGIRMFLDAHL